MRTTLRLIVRQHRLGFGMVVIGSIVLLLGIVAFRLWLSVGEAGACFEASRRAMPDEEAVRWAMRCQFLTEILSPVSMVLFVGGNGIPAFAAMFLAAPIVSAEVELGTATTAWVMARTRQAWLLPRIGVVLLVGVGMAAIVGLALDWLASLLYIDGSPWAVMNGYFMRGAIVPSRVLVGVAAGLFTGALLGRQMPALLFGFALGAGLLFGLYNVDMEINRANARLYEGGGLAVDYRLIDNRTGAVLTYEEANSILTWDDPTFGERFRDVQVGIPDADAPLVMARNVALHGVTALVLIGATMVIVERRRPY